MWHGRFKVKHSKFSVFTLHLLLDSPQTPRQWHSLTLRPQPQASPAGPGSSSVSRPAAPWLAVHCLGWGTFNRHVRTLRSLSTGHGAGLSSLRFPGCGTSDAATQSTSLLQLSHQGTIVRKCMNCLRGSKSKLTGSVVRLKILPRLLGVSLSGS